MATKLRIHLSFRQSQFTHHDTLTMGKPFFTKKQKAAMRERRKKKKLAHTEDGNIKNGVVDEVKEHDAPENTVDALSPPASASKKRPRDEDADTNKNNADTTSTSLDLTTKLIHGKLYVLMPSDLSTKDAKKFRKDARRKLRESSSHDPSSSEIEFATKEDMPSLAHRSKKKKRQKEFPSIKELLKQKQHLEDLQKEENKLQEKLN